MRRSPQLARARASQTPPPIRKPPWGYDTPYDEVAGIAGHVAFYPDKVDILVE